MVVTKSSVFLLHGLMEKLKIKSKQTLKDIGLVNTYIGDNSHAVPYKDSIYLLFSNKNGILLQDFIDNWCQDEVIAEYDYDGHVMLVYQYPAKWIRVYNLFKIGKYSQFPNDYKNLFDKRASIDERRFYESHPCFDKCTLSLAWLIFTKSPILKEWVEYNVDARIPPDSELWGIPNMNEEIFNIEHLKEVENAQ